MESAIAIFGEAEKGEYQTAYLCRSLPQLMEYLGNPPEESLGLHYAVQALLYHYSLIFFRVHEEGFSEEDYLLGLKLLKDQEQIPSILALGAPGVGNAHLIEAFAPICRLYHSVLLIKENDLYDYLMA